MEVPAVTVSAVRFPPVTLRVAAEEAEVTTPPEMLATPPVRTFSEVILAVLSRVPVTSVTLAEPALKLAFAPVATVTLPSVALELKVPPVTFERPVTVAVPPVMVVEPAVRIDPMVPAEMLAVAPDATFREPRLTPDAKNPPVTLARLVTEPVVSVLFPPVTFSAVSVPPTRLSSPSELAVVIVPLEILAVAPI